MSINNTPDFVSAVVTGENYFFLPIFFGGSYGPAGMFCYASLTIPSCNLLDRWPRLFEQAYKWIIPSPIMPPVSEAAS